MTKHFYHHFLSPVGELHLYANSNELIAVDFNPIMQLRTVPKKTSLLKQTQFELEEYFAKKRNSFSIPLQLQGTDFQVSAWQALQTIPYGRTISYKEQALMIGNKNASRAIGGANGKNPIPIIIPCHRVVAHDGSLGGYSGGLNIKRKLLQLEKG